MLKCRGSKNYTVLNFNKIDIHMSIPPVYVINLRRAPERRLNIQRQLDAFDLSYQFIEAVDGFELHDKDYRITAAEQAGIDKSEIEYLYNNNNWHGGKIGCQLSHLKVYNLMIKNNTPIACVLEDDAYLMPTFPKMLTSFQVIPYEILMFSHYSRTFLDLIKPLKLGYSRTRFFYKLMRYKKYYPQLNSYTVRLMILEALGFYFEKLFTGQVKCAYTSRIGAIPETDKSSWHKTSFKHYIARPHSSNIMIASCMGYMLTLQGAIKWKKEGLSDTIDRIPYNLYQKGGVNLRILVPPCALMIDKYLKGYSFTKPSDHNRHVG